MRLKYVLFLGLLVQLFILPNECVGQESPRFRAELGYLYAFHEDLGITKKDWILVPGTWSAPSNYDGQANTPLLSEIPRGIMLLITTFHLSTRAIV